MKRRAAHAAVDALVRSGMKVGLGTGSTAVEALRRIGELLGTGDLENMLFVPTSLQAETECASLGMGYASLNDPRIGGKLDLTIDGADEVDPAGRLIKGMGGAMLREKIVAAASARYAVVVDESKLVDALGQKSVIPLEIAPEARTLVQIELEGMHIESTIRLGVRKDGPVVTDSGNLILDARIAEPFDPPGLEVALNAIPGILENGIFSRPATDVFAGLASGRVDHLIPES